MRTFQLLLWAVIALLQQHAFADEVRVTVLDHGPVPNALASATLARVTTNVTEVWRRRGELYKNALQYLALVSGCVEINQ